LFSRLFNHAASLAAPRRCGARTATLTFLAWNGSLPLGVVVSPDPREVCDDLESFHQQVEPCDSVCRFRLRRRDRAWRVLGYKTHPKSKNRRLDHQPPVHFARSPSPDSDVHAAFSRKPHQSLLKAVACRDRDNRQDCFRTGELKAGHVPFIGGFAL
jgi:hypothetical protein